MLRFYVQNIIDDAIDSSPTYLQHIIEKLGISTQPITINEHNAASLLMGKCNMSQRSYKNLKKILKAQNAFLPRYEKVKIYIQNQMLECCIVKITIQVVCLCSPI